MLGMMLQQGQCFFYRQATDLVGQQTHFAWRCRIISEFSNCFHLYYISDLGFGDLGIYKSLNRKISKSPVNYAIFLLECPLKFLVGANSPSLCPTMNSVT